MDVLITELTRMQPGFICAAGIEAKTRRRVRPVLDGRLPSRLLVSRGGMLDIGRVIRFKEHRDRPTRPETEDVLVDFDRASVLGSLPGTNFIGALEKVASTDFAPIGGDLRRQNTSISTPEGRGDCSLVVISIPSKGRLLLNQDGKLRFEWPDGLNLSVTDVRLYNDDLQTPSPSAFRLAEQRIRKGSEGYLCLGLTRAFRERHWLQVNAIHFREWPEWRLEGQN